MSWLNTTGARVNLREVTRDVAGTLLPNNEDDWSLWIVPYRIYVRIGKAEATMANWDGPLRLFVWMAMVFSLVIGWHLENMKVLPVGVGFCLGAFIVSGLGLFFRAQLDSGFESRVKQQLELRAKAKAVNLDELAVEAIVALWAIQKRPFLSTLAKMWVNPWALDNNINLGVGDPIRRALKLLHEMPPAPGSAIAGWSQRNYYDQLVEAAANRAEIFRKAWFRTVVVPTFACTFLFRMTGVGGAFLIAYPFLKEILHSIAYR